MFLFYVCVLGLYVLFYVHILKCTHHQMTKYESYNKNKHLAYAAYTATII